MSVDIESYAAPVSGAEPETPQQKTRLAATLLRYGALITFLLILVIFSVSAPFFLSVFNIGNILGQTAITGVLAIGLTVVVIAGGPNVVTGGIDLSLAANMGVSAAIYASLIQAGYGDGAAVIAALGSGLAVGAVNAIAVAGIGIVPLLATLAVMNIIAGLELVLTENTVVPASSDVLTALSSQGPLGIPVLGYVLIAFSLAMSLLVQGTRYGLRLYAVGEFPEAARSARIPVKAYLASAFLISGLCGGLAGILNTAYLSGSSTGSGEMLLPVVVTALLGSVFSRRLVPTIGGTLLSALFVGILLNGFQLLNLSSTLVSGVEGVLILLTVSATTLIRRDV
ncbi:ABC transporter permease [Rhizobium grahamii]|uniref:ABC transporter permease n=1 Tax=Rhizobium grahamii TaxID=1120045 RepID=A0A370KEM5_9HYPH|nr:ABC transporter permease [Rhizobium grahamii]RDJ02024.1 ABC transporter permease [Rhizobium grahamii]